ncbi:hypothetical protein yc1106_06271 [Curvularia clavata]|uniref:DUF6594 domain-containing protein n=1 Tax=Curvularia clavata TaxID=95742 RepID=A0A9Q9DTQ4_CURCL|nr:hypothetical protein yc1106_06271 [Curvularia clavata]
MTELGDIEAGRANKANSEKANQESNPFTPSWTKHPGGYPMIAERTALKPETAIYRRFDALNARHLLYLQAELSILEKKLHEVEEEDNAKGLGYAVNYQHLLEGHDGRGNIQLGLVKAMHKKLNEYNEALIQVSTLSQLKAPQKFDLTDMQSLLEAKDMGPNWLTGVDQWAWGSYACPENRAPDLIAIHPRLKADGLSGFIAEKAVHLFRFGLGRFTRGDPNLGPKVYHDSTVLNLTSWFTCFLTSILPVCSILLMLNLQSTYTKLGVIAVFNLLVSVCLKLLTDAKRSEAFAITAAFAAVQVVFVGTGGNACAA